MNRLVVALIVTVALGLLVAGGAGASPVSDSGVSVSPRSPFRAVAPLTGSRLLRERVSAEDFTRPAQPADTERTLSNERTRSQWTYVLDMAYARQAPSRSAKVVHRLDTYTSDGTPELVLDLKERTLASGEVWVLVRLPMRPNNTVGWVPREHLSRYHVVTTTLLINRRTLTATLWNRGVKMWVARVGIGKRSTPTPAGHFYTRERLIPERRGTIYGDYAFGTSAYSPVLTDWPGGGVIGIHGTNEPRLIPGRPSHGCVRLRNPRVDRLWKLMPLGTPIEIR